MSNGDKRRKPEGMDAAVLDAVREAYRVGGRDAALRVIEAAYPSSAVLEVVERRLAETARVVPEVRSEACDAHGARLGIGARLALIVFVIVPVLGALGYAFGLALGALIRWGTR